MNQRTLEKLKALLVEADTFIPVQEEGKSTFTQINNRKAEYAAYNTSVRYHLSQLLHSDCEYMYEYGSNRAKLNVDLLKFNKELLKRIIMDLEDGTLETIEEAEVSTVATPSLVLVNGESIPVQ